MLVKADTPKAHAYLLAGLDRAYTQQLSLSKETGELELDVDTYPTNPPYPVSPDG